MQIFRNIQLYKLLVFRPSYLLAVMVAMSYTYYFYFSLIREIWLLMFAVVDH